MMRKAMLRSTVASFTVGKAIARKHHNGVTSLATSRRMPPAFSSSTKRRPAFVPLLNNKNHAWLLTRGGAAAESFSTTSTTSTALNSAVAESETTAPVEVFRTDYKPLPHLVTKINMDFVIENGKTTVTSELFIEPNSSVEGGGDLVLDGDESCVKLMSVSIDGKELEKGKEYDLEPQKMIIKSPAPGTVLKTVVEIVPEENTQLSGLYKSGPMYCSQCEAMGFRRITYYPDRPDNMAVFENIRLEADEKDYPVLLSNGNLVDSGKLENGRHFASWSDPFPKPSYLFAAVVGNLGYIEDTYTTTSGREVKLGVYSEKENVDKLHYAMDSLKRSMKWDEDKFGLEYDLDLYNIVAVESFNMGAMENKGLNVFNTAYVLADKDTASDADFERVEGVIGHEYFHNWTGNRVTCRDWFQLTLKEGLTVFRDQEFSGDMNSNAVKRIEDVRMVRARQFAEDAGPMAHPIRPESYISMDNFYTATVYVKGAEVIRMYNTLLGTEGFRKGMDLYFERHDGTGVTCDDFLQAMADANDVDLSQFSLWYSTPGTPTVKYSSAYDASTGVFSLTLEQESKSDKPLHIPVSVGLMDKESGEEVVPTTVLDLKESKQTFEFNVKGDVVPSILRDFSAPVKLMPDSGAVDEEALAFLAAEDTDGFNRWEAGQRLYTSSIFQNMNGKESEKTLQYVFDAFERTLKGEKLDDYSIQAYALLLPTEATLSEEMEIIDPTAIHKARGAVKQKIARKFQNEISAKYEELSGLVEADGELSVDAKSIGLRRLRNVMLEYLCSIKETPEEQKAAAELAKKHFENASGMTDKMAALSALASMEGKGTEARDWALQKFYDDADGYSLVVDKWFSVQALANLPDVLDRVKKLTKHPDFTLEVPNRCRSLVSVFTMNAPAFHNPSGEGYKFIGELLVELDKLNPQVSSRLASSLIRWRRYDEKLGALMKAELEKLKAMKPISEDLYEIVSKALD
ncbi:Puromycin-sensitive aminopeptidase [Seminavis robusta]|uniref:Puromycin-sensitive aminopeptidase n=1 Tax=Seminavis robusta TaxID=568900 RepID=A0A9N8HF55_9STRA|nr:Puromycin-sensitive aminopeptidase [Seminavis robusta]|eukprot:Sro552_g165030.1 Puromycin-sensitive aminopeptidase (970) ;mRNA; r:13060-16461